MHLKPDELDFFGEIEAFINFSHAPNVAFAVFGYLGDLPVADKIPHFASFNLFTNFTAFPAARC